MLSFKTFLQEKYIHLAFEIGIILKGLHAFIEVVSGIALFFVSQQLISQVVSFITQSELSEDPQDFVAHFLFQSAQYLTLDTQNFAAFYLLSHGILKGFLVVNLLKERLWAFPLSIAVFSLFIVYQLFRYSFTHSIWLLLLTALDIVVIWLTWREYQYRKLSSSR